MTPDLFDTAAGVLRMALLYSVALFLPVTLQLLLLFATGWVFFRLATRVSSTITTLLVAIGTPLHELSHAVARLITFCGVVDIKLVSEEVRIAHVRPKRRHPIGNFLAGIAPLLGGVLVLWLTASYIIPGFEMPTIEPPRLDPNGAASLGMVLREALDYLGRFVQAAYQNLPGLQWGNWRTYVGLYIAFSVGLGITPSPGDLKTFFSALPVVALLGLGVFALFYASGDVEAQFAAFRDGLWPHVLKFSTAVTYAFVLTSLGVLVFLPLRLFSKVRTTEGAATRESGGAVTQESGRAVTQESGRAKNPRPPLSRG